MKYEKRNIVTDDENPNGGQDRAVPPFFVGEVEALSWDDVGDRYGYDSHSIYPAFQSEERRWYHTWCYNQRGEYKATGYGSELLSFEDGIRLLVEHDCFRFPVPFPEKAWPNKAYREAVRVWQAVWKGDPARQPLKAAFGVSENDFADPCNVCHLQEASFEHSYDEKVTRIIPSGFAEAKQLPHERLCLACAATRLPEVREALDALEALRLAVLTAETEGQGEKLEEEG